ncbi:hypothetical protein TALC_00882 [Thermoplasmatales archaeon BRNA1]|nr:hypothetical protein TALC_00882 [Thermoplasmatales archaeon BRNA1]
MAYETELISSNDVQELLIKYREQFLFHSKAEINGIIVELHTGVREHVDMWRDNFYSASERIKSHCRLYCVRDDGEDLRVDFDPETLTAFLYNFDYYGWVKSIALGITGYMLEGVHNIYSVHGSAVSFDDVGVAIIAPSKAGKTTQSWGLLRDRNSCLISDDWFFVTFGNGRPMIRGSEKNCYIDADIGDVWEEFRPLLDNVKLDNKGRGIANIRWITGEASVRSTCSLRYVILLEREKGDKNIVQKMTAHQALEYLLLNDFCNPHQIVRDPFRRSIRTAFFKRMLEACDCYLVNTVGTPQDTQDIIRKIIGGS